jgi:ABC-type lipoprotein export system ATPase subunit
MIYHVYSRKIYFKCMTISISHFIKTFSKTSQPTLNIESFQVSEGESVALIGKSGSGKSTLLYAIAGIILPTSGSIKVAGVELTALTESQRDRFRAEHIGYVFQTFNLLQGLTALENILLAMGFANKIKESKMRAISLLKRVGLESKMGHKPHELSVGEQQRVAIARALANEPKILLADEPTANLDEQNTSIVLQLLHEVSAENKRTLILVTHERDVASLLPRSVDLKSINQI